MIINDVNQIIGGMGLALSVIGLLQAISGTYFDRLTKGFLRSFFAILVAYAACVLASQISLRFTGGSWPIVSTVTIFLHSFLASVLALLFPWFIVVYAGQTDWMHTRVFRVTFILWVVYLALLVYTQFSDTIYTVDADNVYRRGPWYPVLLVPTLLIMATNALAFIHRYDKYSRRLRIALLAYLIAPIVAMLVQMAVYGIHMVVLGTTVAALFLLAYILQEQTEHYYEKEQENAQLRVDIMFTQIQPHFLYNTLGAIQSLCRSDPALAEKSVQKFARYLRGNMDSISHREAIPFHQELEHTRLYLELEQLRYEDALQVHYDLETTAFLLPTLTLQPLAENAVRHGVRGRLDGRGTVTVSTREYPDRIEVSVQDNGPGFDPTKPPPKDGRTHIGLRNVRERLQSVSGGRLEIESSPERGTKATIVLPKEAD